MLIKFTQPLDFLIPGFPRFRNRSSRPVQHQRLPQLHDGGRRRDLRQDGIHPGIGLERGAAKQYTVKNLLRRR